MTQKIVEHGTTVPESEIATTSKASFWLSVHHLFDDTRQTVSPLGREIRSKKNTRECRNLGRLGDAQVAKSKKTILIA